MLSSEMYETQYSFIKIVSPRFIIDTVEATNQGGEAIFLIPFSFRKNSRTGLANWVDEIINFNVDKWEMSDEYKGKVMFWWENQGAQSVTNDRSKSYPQRIKI